MILLMRGDDDGRTASSMQPNQELRPVAAEDVSPETEGGLPATRQPLAGLLASVFAPFGATPRRAAEAGRPRMVLLSATAHGEGRECQ